MGLDMNLGKKMVVVGGGNVAMDCVRSALRMGVEEVHLVYRRSKDEMPADIEEVEAAEKEGVIFNYLSKPTKIITVRGKVKGIELIRMKLEEPDETGRRRVTPIEDSKYIIDADFIVVAIGQTVDTSFLSGNDGITLNRWINIEVDKNLMTKRRGVFAGGDCVTGPATLIEAMAQGEKAAKSIDDYLTYGRVKFKQEDRMSELISHIRRISTDDVKLPLKNQYRVKVRELDPEIRKELFEEVEKPISVEEAYGEAERCMRCYRIYSVVTEH
jgi:formate dehydrogenase beta subunit